MRNSVSCRSYNCCRYRISGKTSKILISATTETKWKKKCFRNCYFFFSEGRCTVNDVRDIGYVRRSNKQQFINTGQDVVEVHRSRFYHKNDELVIYIYASLFFCLKSHLVRQRLTEDRINSRPQNNVLKLVYSFS